MDVTHLEIPAELMGLLEAAAGEWGRHGSQLGHPRPHPWGAGAGAAGCAVAAREVNAGCVVLVPPPALQPDSQLTLPLDINDYPMAKYVRGHFQVRVAPAARRRAPALVGEGLVGFLGALDAVEWFGLGSPHAAQWCHGA